MGLLDDNEAAIAIAGSVNPITAQTNALMLVNKLKNNK